MQNNSTIIANVPFGSAEIIIEIPELDCTIRRTVTKDDITKKNNSLYPPGLRIEYLESIPDTFGRPNENIWKTKILHSKAETPQLRKKLETNLGYTFLPISRRRQSRNSPRYDRLLRNSASELQTDADFNRYFAEQIKAVWEDFHQKTLSKIRFIQQRGLALILSELFAGKDNETPPEITEQGLEKEHELVVDYLVDQKIPIAFTLEKFIERYNQDSYLRRVVFDIQEIKKDIEKAQAPELEFQTVLQGMFRESKRLVIGDNVGGAGSTIRVEIDGSHIPLESLSSGEQQLIHILLETLAVGKSTIMVDEPEISMHVDWQQRLVSSMQRINPNAQIILATHSPEIMANVPVEFIFQL